MHCFQFKAMLLYLNYLYPLQLSWNAFYKFHPFYSPSTDCDATWLRYCYESMKTPHTSPPAINTVHYCHKAKWNNNKNSCSVLVGKTDLTNLFLTMFEKPCTERRLNYVKWKRVPVSARRPPLEAAWKAPLDAQTILTGSLRWTATNLCWIGPHLKIG